MPKSISYDIETATPSDFDEITEVWEASVRASHEFLKPEDILYFRDLVRQQYLQMVQLFCIRDAQQNICGFMGVLDDKLEMLFIAPEHLRKGMGKAFLDFALKELQVRKVDVNEQNEKALAFYKHAGFEVVGRSAIDGSGRPYPILFLELRSTESSI